MPVHRVAGGRRSPSWSCRYRQRDIAKGFRRDPDVSGYRLWITMAEQVREHSGTRPGIKLARGVRVAQHVAAKVRCRYPRCLGMLDEDVPNRRRCAERAERHLRLYEQV